MTMMTSAEYHHRLTALLARPMFWHKKSIDLDYRSDNYLFRNL